MTSTTLELLQKYSVPGPRYTSYPTAPYFHTQFGEADWAAALAASSPDRELSLYAHIPFCDSLCHYCGCNMVATRDYSKTQPYMAMLLFGLPRRVGLQRHVPILRPWTAELIRDTTRNLHRANPAMPPWMGSEAERVALAVYLARLSQENP